MIFTAIDFETATGYRDSICQVGIVRVQDGRTIEEVCHLVQPPNNFYWCQFTANVHGISAADTAQAPTFDEVWPLISPFIEGQIVVAHNGFRFDFECLRQTLARYDLLEPQYEKRCTLHIYGRNLADLCEEHHIELNHHDALSDARACAMLFQRALERGLV
jgi:DNA polymerase-3 subunit epsilon